MKPYSMMNVPDNLSSDMPALAHHYPMAAEVIRSGKHWLSRLTWNGQSRMVQRHQTKSEAVARAGTLRVKDWLSTERNPGPSAIPARWTPATVSRKGGQIQIRMGGR
jgi:hypothetical protein